MLASLLVMAMVGLFAMAIYSYFVGFSAIKMLLTGAGGTFAGIFVDYYSSFTSVLDAGISNFFQPGYLGPSILVAGILVWVLVMVLNLTSTWDTDPTLLQ